MFEGKKSSFLHAFEDPGSGVRPETCMVIYRFGQGVQVVLHAIGERAQTVLGLIDEIGRVFYGTRERRRDVFQGVLERYSPVGVGRSSVHLKIRIDKREHSYISLRGRRNRCFFIGYAVTHANAFEKEIFDNLKREKQYDVRVFRSVDVRKSLRNDAVLNKPPNESCTK